MRLRAGVLAAVCLLTVACTPTDPGPSPTPTPLPSRTETAVEREQRVAYEAAEAAYLTALSETERLLRAGGSTTVPQTIKDVSAGPYLDDIAFILSDYRKLGDTRKGSSVIERVLRQGYEARELLLLICEDGRGISVYDKRGKLKSKGIRAVYDVVARRVASDWKIYSSEYREGVTCPD